jgi:D-alanyl-D-alanine carboxypeptidase
VPAVIELHGPLDGLLDEFLDAHADMPAVVLHVDAPGAGGSWTGGAGVASRGGAPVTGHECFRIASITKTFVAVGVLRMVERGVVGLDDPALPMIPEPAASMFAAAMAEAPAITVRQLLQHTSGVYDFGNDANYRRAIAKDPTRVWSATDLIGVAFEHGTSYGPPGEAFHYSDTGYVLLALALEHHARAPFAAALRAASGIDELGLACTWLEGKEPVPPGAPTRLHQHMGDVDTFGFDPSFDGYGGGGLVSTGGDLARFLRALVAGELLGREATAAMLSCSAVTDLGDIGQRCGLGIFESTVDGIVRIGHEGFWGTWMYHFPEHDVTVAGAHTSIPFDMPAKQRLLNGVARLLSRS